MNRVSEECEAEAAALLARIGRRVRAARRAQKLTRKALSDRSGVSLRYLAQIEAGEGNTSILILHRVAAALSAPLESLVAAPLATENDPRAGRVALIGLRGAGKSTLGKRLADESGAEFVELNDEIEARNGMAIGDLIALYGPEGFRRLEADALARVMTRRDRLVLAVAGGVVEDHA